MASSKRPPADENTVRDTAPVGDADTVAGATGAVTEAPVVLAAASTTRRTATATVDSPAAPAKKAPRKAAAKKAAGKAKAADTAEAGATATEADGETAEGDAPESAEGSEFTWDEDAEEESEALRQARKDAEMTASADSVRAYLKQIGKVALLNAEEEVDLAKRIEAGLYAAERIRQADEANEKLTTQMRRDLRWIVRDGGWWIGLSTALGFWLAFVLG